MRKYPKYGSRQEANRANAQHSTGPATPAGKAVSSKNSFKHGLYSKQLVTDNEDAAELDALKADLIAEHQPGSVTEELLVNEMAEHYWRLKRYRRYETCAMKDGSFKIPQVTAVVRFMNAADRGFHKALKSLQELQKQRGFVPQKSQPQIGVVAAAANGPAVNAGFVPHFQTASGFVPPKTDSNSAAHTPTQTANHFADTPEGIKTAA